jgi:hypothetical protein
MQNRSPVIRNYVSIHVSQLEAVNKEKSRNENKTKTEEEKKRHMEETQK